MIFEGSARIVSCLGGRCRKLRFHHIAFRCVGLLSALVLVLSGGLHPAFATGPMVTPSSDVVVTPTGAANIHVPIEIPPGTAGVVPSLSIRYSGGSSNGLLGLGWMLDGLPSITRCARNLAQDGMSYPVTYGQYDMLCLSGKRLVEVESVDGGEFRFELDDFTRIFSRPGWFEVRTKDGLILEFGRTEDALTYVFEDASQRNRNVDSWHVNKVRDRSGNYYTVKYTKFAYFAAGNEVYDSELDPHNEYLVHRETMPSRIDYTGNESAAVSPHNSVQFFYEPIRYRGTDASIVKYRGGARISVSNRLASVKTFTGSQLVSNYRLAYVDSSVGVNRDFSVATHELLDSVQRCDASDACLDPVRFSYLSAVPLNDKSFISSTDPGLEKSVPYVATLSRGRDGVLWMKADANGKLTGQFQVRLSNGDGTFQSGQIFNQGLVGDFSVYLGDFQGKGVSDIILKSRVDSVTYFYTNDGNGVFTFRPDAFSSVYGSSQRARFTIGDFEGRGRASIIVDDITKPGTYVCVCTGNEFSFTILRPGDGHGGRAKTHVADFNGDGIADLLSEHLDQKTGLPTNTWYVAFGVGAYDAGRFDLPPAQQKGAPSVHTMSGPGRVFVADVNADGLDDVLFERIEGPSSATPSKTIGRIEVFLSKGDGTFIEGQPLVMQFGAGIGIVGIGRFSGSPYNDLLLGEIDDMGFLQRHGSPDLDSVTISVNRGNGTFRSVSSIPAKRASRLYVGNFSGSGRPSILYAMAKRDYYGNRDRSDQGGTTGETSIVGAWSEQGSNLLTNVSSRHRSTQISYSTLWDSSVYSYVSSALVRMPSRSQTVVSRTTSKDSHQYAHATSYQYSGGVVHPNGYGFTGFQIVATVDQLRRITRTDRYLTAPAAATIMPLLMSSDIKASIDERSVLLKRERYQYTNVPLSSLLGQKRRRFVERARVETETADLDGSNFPTSVVADEYDCVAAVPCFGNLLKRTKTITGLNGYSSVTANTYAPPDIANWLIGKLEQSSVTNTLSGSSATRTVSHTFAAETGLITSRTVEPGNPAFRLDVGYGRDSFGNITATTVSGADIVPRMSSLVWSSGGAFPATATNALGHSSSSSFDPRFGKPTGQTDVNGLTHSSEYDTFGRLAQERRPDGTGNKYIYASCDQTGEGGCPAGASYLVQVTPVKTDGVQIGAQRTEYFDSNGRVLQSDVQSFDGRLSRVLTQYDALGRAIKVSAPFFAASSTPVFTNYTYDILDRVTRVDRPDGSWDKREYHGLTTIDTNSSGQSSTTVRNQLGQIASRQDALGHVTSYAYDVNGHLASVTDPAGNTTSYSYDLRERATEVLDPDAGRRTYAYDVADQVISQTDAKGAITTFSYDLLGRTISRIEADLTSNWTYDSQPNGVGKLAAAATSAGYHRVHNYDLLGRPSQTHLTIDGAVYAFERSYDALGHLSGVTYPSGMAVSYSYNSLGYLAAIADSAANVPLWSVDASDAALRLTRETFGNGVATSRSFDVNTNRLRSIEAGSNHAIQNLSFGWDTVGNLSQRIDANQGLTETFTYDALDRLTQSHIAGGSTKTFSYDAIGNITSKSDVGTYSYAASGAGSVRPHAVASITGTVHNGVNAIANPNYVYDANGSLISGGGRNLTYTASDLPATVTAGSVSLSFSYDDERKRIKQIAPEGTTLYLNTGGLMVEKFVSAEGGESWRTYLRSGDRVFGVRTTGGESDNRTLYFHNDHLGSISAVTDETGNVLERNGYDAWGKRRHPGGVDDAANSITSRTTRGYIEQEHLGSVGLVHLNTRLYDPQIGRFMSSDPIGLNGGPNVYSYALNNPLSLIDPRGTYPVDIVLPTLHVRCWSCAANLGASYGAGTSAMVGSIVSGGIAAALYANRIHYEYINSPDYKTMQSYRSSLGNPNITCGVATCGALSSAWERNAWLSAFAGWDRAAYEAWARDPCKQECQQRQREAAIVNQRIQDSVGAENSASPTSPPSYLSLGSASSAMPGISGNVSSMGGYGQVAACIPCGYAVGVGAYELWIGAGLAAGSGVVGSAIILNEAKNSKIGGENKSDQRPTKTPNDGEPGSRHINPGSGQERWYGPDRLPVKDIDSDHNHGQGVPHVHDWGRDANGGPTRGPGRPFDPKTDTWKP